MTRNIGGYGAALVLASAVAITELVLLVSLVLDLSPSDRVAGRFGIAVLIVFGLWIHSNVARYLGAAWFLGTVAVVIWSAVSSGGSAAGFGPLLAIVLSALSLLTAYVLLASRQFAAEFAHRRKTRPAYKKILGRSVMVVLVAAAVIASAYDIYWMTIAR